MDGWRKIGTNLHIHKVEVDKKYFENAKHGSSLARLRKVDKQQSSFFFRESWTCLMDFSFGNIPFTATPNINI